jgi:hypothetical protein
VNESEAPPPELLGLFAAERDAPRVDANTRATLRNRLAASFANDAPPDELRLAKRRRLELAHATAQEPVAAPPASGRKRGKMNFFDKRIMGAATLIAVAFGLIGVTVYKRHTDASASKRHDPGPSVDLGRSSAVAPRFSPVAPTTGADLAITEGESVWIHAPFGGAVEIEIQSQCNAEVELSRASNVMVVRESERADASALSTKSSGSIIAGTKSPDGRASTYHLSPSVDLIDRDHDGVYVYTSRCPEQPPLHGNIVVDRVDISEPIGGSVRPETSSWFANAQVDSGVVEHGIHVFGTVLPGARVSIGTTSLALGPAEPTGSDTPIYLTFTTDVPGSPEHVVVRVDDANGTHFYVRQPSGACTTTMTAPKQTAAMLDAQGYHSGALGVFETVMAACKPDLHTLSLAFEYACKASDTEAARKYWRKLPADLQRTLEPLCARNEITREALDGP